MNLLEVNFRRGCFIEIKKWESLFSSIPQIVDRLETLAPLHSLAGRVGASLIALEKSHQQIIAQLDRTEGKLQSFFLRGTFKGIVPSIRPSSSTFRTIKYF